MAEVALLFDMACPMTENNPSTWCKNCKLAVDMVVEKYCGMEKLGDIPYYKIEAEFDKYPCQDTRPISLSVAGGVCDA